VLSEAARLHETLGDAETAVAALLDAQART
jgi:hypothetical protein